MHSKFDVIAIAASRGRVTLLMCALALCVAAGPRAAHASVLKSEVVGAHYKGNAAAQIELNRVKSRLRLNNIPGALDAVEVAARKDSLSGEVFDQMGMLLLRQGNYRTAYSAFNRAAVLAPEQAPIWNRLAQVSLTQLGYEQEGLNALRFAFAADSQYATAYYTEFVYHWARCEFDLAAGSIQHARDIEQDEGRSLIWYSAQLGFQLAEGNYPQIARALEVHLAQATNDITAKQHLVHARRGMGQNAGARDLLNELLQIDDRQPVWLVEAGLVRRALGDRDSALVFFNRALKADSTSYDAGYNRAIELLARRDTVAAWSQLRRLRTVDPENFLAPLLASRIARAEGDSARARLAFDEARRLNPALGLASMGRLGAAPAVPAWSSAELEAAEALIEQGEFELAGDKLYEAGKDKEKRGAALFWISHTGRISGGAPGLAVISAQAAAEAMNGDPVLVRALAEAQFAAGDLRRATGNLAGVHKTAPDDLIATALFAQALLEGGDSAGARAVFSEGAGTPTRSYRYESQRAAVLSELKDAGAAIARQRAAAVDYLPTGS